MLVVHAGDGRSAQNIGIGSYTLVLGPTSLHSDVGLYMLVFFVELGVTVKE